MHARDPIDLLSTAGGASSTSSSTTATAAFGAASPPSPPPPPPPAPGTKQYLSIDSAYNTKHIDGHNVSSAKHDCQSHYQLGNELTFATADANTDAHAAERLFPLADATAASDSAETSVPADPTTMAESAATSSCFCASDRPSRLDTTMFYIFWCKCGGYERNNC